MLRHLRTRTVITSLVLLAVPVLGADDKPPVFYFGGKAIFVGMPQAEALSALSKCCKLSPSSLMEAQREDWLKFGTMVGQMILKENGEGPTPQILGSIYFRRGKVLSVTRPLGEEAYVPWSEDTLGFARTLERSLAPLTGDFDTAARISLRHHRTTNGESEIISFTLPTGRGVRITVVHLDKAFEGAPPESKDQVNMEEFLESPTP
jgi:hypothetical protein